MSKGNKGEQGRNERRRNMSTKKKNGKGREKTVCEYREGDEKGKK